VQVESAALLEARPPRASLATDAGGAIPHAWHAYIGDIPRWVDKPPVAAYLQADCADLAEARALIGDAGAPAGCGDGQPRPLSGPLKVGLVWSSNPAVVPENRTARNVASTLINGWLGELGKVTFYSLMPTPHVERIAEVPDLPLVDLSAFVTDFSRTAAAIQCLDCVVSVCTSTANLAGALGADLHVLLQRHADWRWADGGRAWYPNVTLYRQARRGDWSAPLAALADRLASTSGA
jgi:hypothetical protein